MAKDVSTAARSSGTGQGSSGAKPGLFGVYKRTQGRMARQVTFLAIALTIAIGAWTLYQGILFEFPFGVRVGVPAAILAVGIAFAYWIVQWPRFADFLIAVEAEMVKVTWPSRSELFKSAIVVIITIFGLAILLFGYDLIWQSVLAVIFNR